MKKLYIHDNQIILNVIEKFVNLSISNNLLGGTILVKFESLFGGTSFLQEEDKRVSLLLHKEIKFSFYIGGGTLVK